MVFPFLIAWSDILARENESERLMIWNHEDNLYEESQLKKVPVQDRYIGG